MICRLKGCGKEFPPSKEHPHKVFCSYKCRRAGQRQRQRDQRARELVEHPKPKKSSKPKQRKRLVCKWCGMRHRTDKCKTKGKAVKQFGTVVNGKYKPPPGVVVRYITLPRNVFGEELEKVLALEKGARK